MSDEVKIADTKKLEFEVPQITDERLAELAERIKPVIRKNDVLYSIKPVDLRKIAFIWDPTEDGEAPALESIGEIRTYHKFGHPGFFKPSIAEVLAMIPDEFINNVEFFEIIESPKNADDLNKEKEALAMGYHVARTRLYKRVKEN